MTRRIPRILLLAGMICLGSIVFHSLGSAAGGAPPAADPVVKPAPADPQQPSKPPAAEEEKKGDPNIVYFNPQHDLWLDKANKQVVMKGKIAVREGNLEMFACPQGTKEHESIVAVSTKALPVHAALLAAGAKPGHPAKFGDTFTPASGTEIEVLVRWTDEKGAKQQARGQDWIRNMKTGKPLEYPWVFGGSGFQTDPDTGEKYYYADAGDFICVANFPTAMLDLPIESPKAWEEHLFEPFTEHIPARATDVELVLTPKSDQAPAKDDPKQPTPKESEKGPETKQAPSK
jgi:hypothetical protein